MVCSVDGSFRATFGWLEAEIKKNESQHIILLSLVSIGFKNGLEKNLKDEAWFTGFIELPRRVELHFEHDSHMSFTWFTLHRILYTALPGASEKCAWHLQPRL